MIKIGLSTLQQEIGLGDVVKKVLDHVNIKMDACGCEARKKWLNDRMIFVPYGKDKK